MKNRLQWNCSSIKISTSASLQKEKKCNIVFWVEQIPSEADPLIKLIPNS